MKKSVVFMAAAAATLFTFVTSYAATYDSSDRYVTSDIASGKSTVLIIKGNTEPTDDSIVYINQSDSTFDAQTEFFLKNDAGEGMYTVSFGDATGNPVREIFYIGVENAQYSGDVLMSLIEGDSGYYEDGDVYNIGYKATVSIGTYRSVIIKKSNGSYMGCSLPTVLSGTGIAEIGIQINGVSSLNDISKVWLSTRTINGTTATVGSAE